MPDTLVREGPHTTLVDLVLSAQIAGQVGELKEAFELYESNAVATKVKEKKDGLISEPNLGYVLRSVGQNPTDAQVKDFFLKYSKDGKVCRLSFRSDTSPWPSVTPLSPQPTSLLTAARGVAGPLALATRPHAFLAVLPSPARLNIKTQPAYFAGCLDAMHDPTGYEKGAASDEMERLLD